MENSFVKDIGRHSIIFNGPVYIAGFGCVGGKKEGEGPLGECFDLISDDAYYGEKTWEKAESKMQQMALRYALNKAHMEIDDIKYLFAGDLLGQLMATSFAVREMQVPLLGVYGACSTFGEAIGLAAMAVDGGYANNTMALTSSHFSGAEKQFRFPLDYGNQRPLSATWTVTGAASIVLSRTKKSKCIIKGITTGHIEDYGIKDSMNMGATMAPAAAATIKANLDEWNVKPDYYDKIVTGDLGKFGKKILLDMLKVQGYDIAGNYMDCGIEIYDCVSQDCHCGGSGCACSACVLCGYLLKKMEIGDLKRILFVPTGALLSSTSFNEGDSIPAIAHGVVIERV